MLSLEQLELILLHGGYAGLNILPRHGQLSLLQLPEFLALPVHHLRPLLRLLADEALNARVVDERALAAIFILNKTLHRI